MPGIMDEKDGYVRAEGAGSCAFAVSTGGCAHSSTTSHVIFPSIVGGYMPGTMVQKDSYDRDEAQIKRSELV